LDITIAETGAPILGGTLAYLDCRLYEVLSGGDHDIFIGEVVAGEAHDSQPLIFYNDERGQERRYEPEPVSLSIRELGISGWLKGKAATSK
jgi:flavin reductase (DIM6/NTAB) family NADH-FMN oxidoreductase RutF